MIDPALNEKLAEVAREVFGEDVSLRVVDPKAIKLLKRNARFMSKGTFDQLTSNLAQDRMLQSVPLCHTLADGTLECLSGNHRVQAAVKAGLERILVLVITKELTRDEQVAIQLSHNALSGQDDKTILAGLWAEMGTLEAKLYAGLDSELIGELQKISFQGFAAEPIRTESITLWFLPEELEDLTKLLEAFERQAVGSKLFLAPLSHYERLWKALVAKKKSADVKNTAVALMLLIEALEKGEIQSGGSTGEAAGTTGSGPFKPGTPLQPPAGDGSSESVESASQPNGSQSTSSPKHKRPVKSKRRGSHRGGRRVSV